MVKPPLINREQGDIMPACIAAIFVLLFAFCALVDPSAARFLKTAQDTALNRTQAEVFTPACALRLKNTETPGADLAKTALETLRKSGFDGKVTVWFFEAPSTQTGAAKRLFVVGIQTEKVMDTIVSRGLGVDTIPTGTHVVFSVVPYSEAKAWRPSKSDNGLYSAEDGKNTLSYSAKTNIDDFPEEIQDEVKLQVANLKKEG